MMMGVRFEICFITAMIFSRRDDTGKSSGL
jgi:hypothetical protein